MADIQKMLELCRTRQWKVEDLDWSGTPRPMSRSDEMDIVQFFTNMAAIERLAKALFAEQKRRAHTDDLREIFESFVGDEERHAQAAEKLARYYNVHQYKTYRISRALRRFREPFLKAVRHASPEVATAYVTAGELMLDIALLRSINSYVDDDMSNQVMKLINRDEARHVAMDYHMTEYYASEEYLAKRRAMPAPSRREKLQSAWYTSNMFFYARPFLKQVFLDPMDLTDPEGERMREAFKRMQLLNRKPGISEQPMAKFIYGMRRIYGTPVVGDLFGGIISRIAGAPGKYMVDLYNAEEESRLEKMSIDDMAKEAMAAKF